MSREVNDFRAGASAMDKTRKKVCDAAIRCFDQFGPKRTFMADIAEEAGISRKTLYRLFDDRSSLIEYILYQRMAKMTQDIRRKMSDFEGFEEAMIEGSIISIASGRNDDLFNKIVKTDTNHRVEQFLFRGNDLIIADMMETWKPVVETGRKDGHVRLDLEDELIVELIINVHALLFIRDDYNETKQRAFIRRFLIPSLRP